jgi:1-acyl-sn-glycerol-3-phosphate acyltransferase
MTTTLLENFLAMCKRSNCKLDVVAVFKEAYKACSQSARDCAQLGMVEPLPTSVSLLNLLTDQLVSKDSQLINSYNLQIAFNFMISGGNVLMIQNHTSGADTFVWRTLVNRCFHQRPADSFAYMSGHIVNIYPVPLIFAGGFRRIQIFSERYKQFSKELNISEEEMIKQNCRALRSLMKFVEPGGKLVGLYPEGGRGEGSLKYGDPNTVIIAEAISRSGELMILPTYVEGATSILPVQRGPNEFNDFLKYIRPGCANIICGTPFYWSGVDKSSKESIHAAIMTAIAELAPDDLARGPWALKTVNQYQN